MPFWEFELFIKELENLVKEESKQNEEQMDKSGAKDMMKMVRSGNMSKMTHNATPKMPSMSMPKMPKM